MDTVRIDTFREFAKCIQYPMVVFEVESGTIIDLNYEAEVFFGKRIDKLFIEPEKVIGKFDFYETLHNRKAMLSQAMHLSTEQHRYVVSGLVNETVIDDTIVYTLLFEAQTGQDEHSLFLERILEQTGIVAIHVEKTEEEYLVRYVSKNMNQYGYTREQLSDGSVSLTSLVCEQDQEAVRRQMKKAETIRADEIDIDCRVITESRQLRDTRLHIHFIYNEQGRLTDYEVLLMDQPVENQLAATQEPIISQKETVADSTFVTGDVSEQLQMLADALSNYADYYCAVLNTKGKQIVRPTGPVANMGLVYDLFERPVFRDQFVEVCSRMEQDTTPQSATVSLDHTQFDMVFAPLMYAGEIVAYWVLVSSAENAAKHLGDVIEQQWKLANNVVECFYMKKQQASVNTQNDSGKQMAQEQALSDILKKLIEIAADNSEKGVWEICETIAYDLGVSDIGSYCLSADGQTVEKIFAWNTESNESKPIDQLQQSIAEYRMMQEYMKEKEWVIIGEHEKEPLLREWLSRIDAQELLLCSVKQEDTVCGYVVYVRKQDCAGFGSQEISLAQTATTLFSKYISYMREEGASSLIRDGFLEAYQHIRDAVFIRDNMTGEIIFANAAMDKLFGKSLVGMQANDIVANQMEQYRHIGGIRKRFVANKKVTKWQSYMKELDQIMNIVEVPVEITNREDCSLVIMKKNKQ